MEDDAMERQRKSRVSPVVHVNGDTTTIDTGIYRRTIREVEPQTQAAVTVKREKSKATFHGYLVKSQAELRADGEAWNAEPLRTFAKIRQDAIRFYMPHAVEVVDHNQPPLMTAMQRFDLGDGLRTYQLPEDAPPIARDAAEVLSALFLAEATTDPGYRQLYALNLGRMYERMLVRQLEPRALIGLRKSKRNQANNQKRAAAAEDENDRRRQAVYQAMRQQERNREPLSFKRAMTAAAVERGCSIDAIKKAKPVNSWTRRKK